MGMKSGVDFFKVSKREKILMPNDIETKRFDIAGKAPMQPGPSPCLDPTLQTGGLDSDPSRIKGQTEIFMKIGELLTDILINRVK